MRQHVGSGSLGRRPELWSWCFALSLAACLARTCGAAPSGLAASALLAVQLGSLLVAAGALALRRRGGAARWPAGDLTLLLVLWVLAAASTLWSVTRSGTAQDVVGLGVVLCFLLATRAWRWQHRGDVIGDAVWIHYVIAALTALALLITLSGADWVFGDYGRWRGLTSNANYAGMVASIAFPIGYWLAVERRGRARAVFVVTTLVLATAIGLSGSRGAALAALASIVVVHVIARRGVRSLVAWGLSVFLLVSVAVGAGAVARAFNPSTAPPQATASTAPAQPSGSPAPGPTQPSVLSPSPTPSATEEPSFGRQEENGSDITSGRLHIWSVLIDAWKHRPLLGYGYGATASVPGADGLTAHNLVLQVLVELGLAGLAVFGALIVVLVRQADWRALPALTAAVAGIAVMELTESSILGMGGPTAVSAWLLVLALASGVLRDEQEPAESGESALDA